MTRLLGLPQELPLAEALRREVAAQLFAGEWPEGSLPAGLDPTTIAPEDLWEKPTTEAVRLMLRHYGTEYRKAQDPEYWTKAYYKSC